MSIFPIRHSTIYISYQNIEIPIALNAHILVSNFLYFFMFEISRNVLKEKSLGIAEQNIRLT